jgi:hypothetical protein
MLTNSWPVLLPSTERARGASNLIEVSDQHQLVLSPPGEGDSRENARASKKKAMPFSFDRCVLVSTVGNISSVAHNRMISPSDRMAKTQNSKNCSSM